VSSLPSTDRSPRAGGSRPASLGATLREARLKKGESLAQVAAATKISKSLLSLIENDRSDVTLRRLALLAEHYGIALGDILPTRGSTDPIVTRRKERRVMHSAEEGLDIHLLARDANRKMMPVLVVLEPGGGSADFWSYEGEELLVVLGGRVLLELEGSTPIVLERGDCAYYASTRQHRCSNIGDDVARMLSVTTPSL
jgi:transcriptional regulator with XRE-family HTH domain